MPKSYPPFNFPFESRPHTTPFFPFCFLSRSPITHPLILPLSIFSQAPPPTPHPLVRHIPSPPLCEPHHYHLLTPWTKPASLHPSTASPHPPPRDKPSPYFPSDVTPKLSYFPFAIIIFVLIKQHAKIDLVFINPDLSLLYFIFIGFCCSSPLLLFLLTFPLRGGCFLRITTGEKYIFFGNSVDLEFWLSLMIIFW